MSDVNIPESLSIHRPVPFQIGPAVVGPGAPVYVIAEAGVNHDGDAGVARELIHAAAEAGADAVKFQVFSAERLVTRDAPAAGYQKRACEKGFSREQGCERGLSHQQPHQRVDTQYELLSRLELSWEDFAELAAYAGRQDIEFLATPFSAADLEFLVSIHVRAIKLASPDIVNTELLERAARTGLPVIASTGAADLDEIAAGVRWFRQAGEREGSPAGAGAREGILAPALPGPLALLHCVSSYPAREDEANLGAIATLAEAFGCVSGFSDHTESLVMGSYAAAAGARIVEKHFTLDRTRPGPDHAFSLEPATMAEYIHHIRQAEGFLGDGRIRVSESQREVRRLSRGSVVAARDIHPGETLTRAMLTVKRPGGGIAPMELERLVGRQARKEIPADTAVAWEAVARAE